jgi:hypothetical protein
MINIDTPIPPLKRQQKTTKNCGVVIISLEADIGR